MRLRLPELQDNDMKGKKLQFKELLRIYKDMENVLYYQDLLYIPEII